MIGQIYSDPPTHFLTGATGFVGGAMLVELLRQTEDPIWVLIRPRPEQSAEQRLRATLTHLAAAYDLPPALLAAAQQRCRAVAGDVTAEDCGVSGALGARATHFWHAAASLRYEERYADEIRATNIGGTRQALSLARQLGAREFNHVSTAYVAGRRAGSIPEEIWSTAETNNCYEQSKLEAELLVAAAGGWIARVLRPSIVIGHSATLAATTFSGLYGFVRQVFQLKGMTDRAQEGLLTRMALRLRADAEVGLNFIPVDSVARQAVAIARADREGGVFHLTHPAPPSVGLTITTIFRAVGLLDPLFVASKDEFSWLDQRFDQRIDFYGSYLVGHKRFERRRSDGVLGAPPAEQALDAARLEAYCRWYLAHLARERANLPVSR